MMGEDSPADPVLYTKQRFPHHLASPPAAAEPRHLHQPPPPQQHQQQPHQNGVVVADEPYTIKCICGFDDDTFDGNVVLCDRCNSWQHITCYYFPQTNLEEDFEHQCADCDPTRRASLDASAAAVRQAELRPSNVASEAARRQKRVGSKSHKKSRTRDFGAAADSWANHDAANPEARAESPRENGPPAKRPKTTHRHSVSTSGRPVNGRKRSDSSPTITVEQPKLPLSQCPPDYLSPDFISVHHDNTHFRHTETNLHLNIDVTNLLSNWLDDPEAFAEATDGKSHNDVFQHFPQPIEELETPIQKHVHVDKDVEFHGKHPTWPYLTVETDLMAGDFVGELRGSIGRRDEYMKDDANQWSKLRHPNHFVFFHPHLPIYIDSRTEGTPLRYARRSCRPNLTMKTIITGAREYRFCFTAITDIPKGAELTIPWDTTHDGQLLNALKKSLSVMSEEDVAHVSDWVGTILAHFGGCACEQPTSKVSSGPCLLAHFDRRLGGKVDIVRHGAKSRSKKKKTPRPALTEAERNATSRASSDGFVINRDGDVDMADDKSISHSTDSKSSRDATPYGAADAISGNLELSERDKRKLLHQEKLFEQMEQDTQQSQRKRKRNSGSNANTPTAPNQPRLRSPTRADGERRRYTGGNSASTKASPVGRTVARSNGIPAVKPEYRDNSTQTEEPEQPRPRTPRGLMHSRSQQLLKRSLVQRQRKREQKERPSLLCSMFDEPEPEAQQEPQHEPEPERIKTNGVSETAENGSADAMDVVETKQESPKIPALSSPTVEMPDAPLEERIADPPDESEIPAPVTNKDSMSPSDQSAQTQPKPPPPPWDSSKENHAPAKDHAMPRVAPMAPMHVDIPPPDFVKSTTPTEQQASTPTSAVATSVPPLTPSVSDSAAAKPSVTKKKMSLADYMRRKTETPATEKSQKDAMKSSPSAGGGDDAASAKDG